MHNSDLALVLYSTSKIGSFDITLVSLVYFAFLQTISIYIFMGNYTNENETNETQKTYLWRWD